jgi:CubicO group peptidase (beta-lactamase class C family)
MLYSFNIIFMHIGGIFVFLLLLAGIQARCYDPSPAFPLLKLHTYNDSPILRDAFHNISASIKKLISQREFDTSSFSIEITTSEKTLWTLHHTAREKDAARPGVKEVDGDSVYRMASVTKAFTTLAIIKQHIAGNLSLDDPINRYLELEGDIPWKDITLRTTASQLSGVPRECMNNKRPIIRRNY